MKYGRLLFVLLVAGGLSISSEFNLRLSPASAANQAAPGSASSSGPPAVVAPAASSAPSGGAGGTTAAGPTNSSAFFKMGRPTLFVLTYASDPITTTYLTYEVTVNLTKAMKSKYWLLPEPAWALADYSLQCQNDKNTRGAIVLYDVENDTGSFNFFVLQNTYAHIYAKALFVDCHHFRTLSNDYSQGIVTRTRAITDTGTPAQSKQPPAVVGKTYVIASPNPAAPPGTTYLSGETETLQPGEEEITTENKSDLPTMRVEWLSRDEIDSRHFAANQYGVPFLSLAALGAYLAARTYTQQTSITQTTPAIPGGSTMNGSVSTMTQKSGNNSALPSGIAYLGFSLSPLSTLTLGGANQTRVLKSAASSVASALTRQLQTECIGSPSKPAALPLNTVCHFFDLVELRKASSK